MCFERDVSPSKHNINKAGAKRLARRDAGKVSLGSSYTSPIISAFLYIPSTTAVLCTKVQGLIR